jgi:hypothetical protein
LVALLNNALRYSVVSRSTSSAGSTQITLAAS